MIKVLVVVYGMVVFVPNAAPTADPTAVDVLFLNSDAWPHVMKHHPSIQQLGGTAGDLTLAEGFEVVMKTPKDGSVSLTAWPNLLSLEQFTSEPEHAQVRTECVEASDACSKDGTPLIAGRLRLEGMWQTRAVSRCTSWDSPVDFWDQAVWDLRPADTLGSEGIEVGRAATGVAFETQVADPAQLALRVKVGDTVQPVTLATSASTACEAFFGEAVPCIVIEVSNATGQPMPEECKTPDPPAECRLDRHFSVYYDLMVDPPETRLLPYVKDNYYACRKGGGIGHDPSPRCPPPTATGG